MNAALLFIGILIGVGVWSVGTYLPFLTYTVKRRAGTSPGTDDERPCELCGRLDCTWPKRVNHRRHE